MKKMLLVLSALLLGVLLCACSAEDKAPSGKLNDVYNEVKAAYGENYLPSMAYDEASISEGLGIDKSLYKEIIAEAPMISIQVDTFIAAEAAEGKAGELETAVKAYRQKLLEDTRQYPVNQLKISASKVYRVDDYVFFVMLGSIGSEETNEDEGKVIELWKKQNEIAKEKIEKVLGKEVTE